MCDTNEWDTIITHWIGYEQEKRRLQKVIREITDKQRPLLATITDNMKQHKLDTLVLGNYTLATVIAVKKDEKGKRSREPLKPLPMLS